MTKNVNGDIYSDLTTNINNNVMNASDERATIDRIVIHHNATTDKNVAMNTWTVANGKQTSAHYEIADNEIWGCVGEQATAWHSGDWNMNLRSIGLEHKNNTGDPTWTISDKTYNTSARLIADICKRYNIPIDSTHIIPHKQVFATACPGGIDVAKLINLAKEVANGGTETQSIKGDEEDMIILKNGEKAYLLNGGKLAYIGKPTTLNNLTKAGIPTASVEDAVFKTFKNTFK